MVERSRNRAINVRITDAEEQMSKELAEHHGLSVSDVIRQLIRQAYVVAFPSKKLKK